MFYFPLGLFSTHISLQPVHSTLCIAFCNNYKHCIHWILFSHLSAFQHYSITHRNFIMKHLNNTTDKYIVLHKKHFSDYFIFFSHTWPVFPKISRYMYTEWNVCIYTSTRKLIFHFSHYENIIFVFVDIEV